MQAKRYELPKGIEAVGAYALEHCDNIAEIIIPSTIIKLEEGALAYCNSLEQVVFHEGLLEIGDSAFEGCDFLSIELPESLETIGSQAFCYCENLVSIYIPPNVSSIGEDAFLYSEDVIIQCKANSYAQHYAIENGIPFIIVG